MPLYDLTAGRVVVVYNGGIITVRKKSGKHPSELPDWLSYQDSNLERQNQNLLCYHYTIAQSSLESEYKGNAKF